MPLEAPGKGKSEGFAIPTRFGSIEKKKPNTATVLKARRGLLAQRLAKAKTPMPIRQNSNVKKAIEPYWKGGDTGVSATNKTYRNRAARLAAIAAAVANTLAERVVLPASPGVAVRGNRVSGIVFLLREWIR